MQTFLPYPDVDASLNCLDYRRLGNQRREAKQILKALRGGKGWANHPATKMWRGYESGLAHYHDRAIDLWIGRGYRNTMEKENPTDVQFPPWFGREDFHSAHRAALLHKNYDYYSQFNWTETPELNYIWP